MQTTNTNAFFQSRKKISKKKKTKKNPPPPQAGLALQLDSSAVAMYDASKSALEYLAIVTGRRADAFGPGDRALMEKHLCKLRYARGGRWR